MQAPLPVAILPRDGFRAADIGAALVPMFSVIHWPLSQNVDASRLRKRGSARSISSRLPDALIAVAAPSFIASGQV